MRQTILFVVLALLSVSCCVSICAAGGAIAGNVLDASTMSGIPGIRVDIYDSGASFVTDAFTDASGNYQTQLDIDPGTYYPVARSTGTWFYSILFGSGIPCHLQSCDPTKAVPVVVNDNQVTTGINFAMFKGGKISGTIINNSTGDPIYRHWVYFYDDAGSMVDNIGVSDSTGYYRSQDAIPAGNYFLLSRSHYRLYLIDELYNNIPCPDLSCDPTTGTSVFVMGGLETTGRDLALNPIPTTMYMDYFEDSILPDWTFVKPSWTESSGVLQGAPTGRKAVALAKPAFSGCQICSINTTMEVADNPYNKVWLYGWYVDNRNTMELLMSEEKDKFILKQRVNGVVVAKAKFNWVMGTGYPIFITIQYDGSKFNFWAKLPDVNPPDMTLTPVGNVPVGTFGFAVKNTTLKIGEVAAYQ